MNRELERLIEAYDTALEKSGDEALRLKAIFDARIEEILTAHPHLDETKLRQAVRLAHRRWKRSQEKPPTLPPSA